MRFIAFAAVSLALEYTIIAVAALGGSVPLGRVLGGEHPLLVICLEAIVLYTPILLSVSCLIRGREPLAGRWRLGAPGALVLPVAHLALVRLPFVLQPDAPWGAFELARRCLSTTIAGAPCLAIAGLAVWGAVVLAARLSLRAALPAVTPWGDRALSGASWLILAVGANAIIFLGSGDGVAS